MASITLDHLLPGQRARITALRTEPTVLQRLMEMGLLEGDEVEMLAVAPLGDPLEISLRDYRLSLRREDASRIEVQPLP
ncbi:MAG: ferrous iron transport protein A [Gemmataceae bacterium]